MCLPIPLLSLFDFVFTIMHPVFLMLFLPNCLAQPLVGIKTFKATPLSRKCKQLMSQSWDEQQANHILKRLKSSTIKKDGTRSKQPATRQIINKGTNRCMGLALRKSIQLHNLFSPALDLISNKAVHITFRSNRSPQIGTILTSNFDTSHSSCSRWSLVTNQVLAALTK